MEYNSTEMFIAIVVIILFLVFIILGCILVYKRSRKIKREGYEELGVIGGVIGITALYIKDGSCFLITNFNLKKAIPIEITSVHEILANAMLCSLEIRYRMNGVPKTMIIRNTPNRLLAIEDKLGYGG